MNAVASRTDMISDDDHDDRLRPGTVRAHYNRLTHELKLYVVDSDGCPQIVAHVALWHLAQYQVRAAILSAWPRAELFGC